MTSPAGQPFRQTEPHCQGSRSVDTQLIHSHHTTIQIIRAASLKRMEQIFDLVFGLPLHPLTVHAAVTLIPLSAVALLLLIFFPAWRKTFFPLTLGALTISVVLAFVAKQSGEALAQRVGNPSEHQALGDILLPASIGLLALGLAFFFLSKSSFPKWATQFAGVAGTVAVVGVVALTVLVGHSGAEATWASRVLANQAEQLPTDPATGSSSESGLSATEVAKHNTASDCWSVIDGNVYDLSGFLPEHPGGQSVIEAICGKDGTKAFAAQHQGQGKPAMELEALLIGPFGSTDGAADSGSGSSDLTSEEVAKHSTGSDCWSVVDGVVYDLTSYVTDHPGGAAIIKELCGRDATASFAGQHGNASKPLAVLTAFEIGKLAGESTLPEATVVYGEEEDDD